MEKTIIYGVFALKVELPRKSDKIVEIKDVADAMKNLKVNDGKFVRAYNRLEDAVFDCYDGNGWLLSRKLEGPDGVANSGCTYLYYPRAIEVISGNI